MTVSIFTLKIRFFDSLVGRCPNAKLALIKQITSNILDYIAKRIIMISYPHLIGKKQD